MLQRKPRLTRAKARHRYSNVAIILHWVTAALILYSLTSGLLRSLLPRGFFQFHVSAGVSILVLSLARVAWRLAHRPPPLLEMTQWERGLAHLVHGLLYAAILIVPFSGWAMISAKPPTGSPGAIWSLSHRPGAAPAPSGPEADKGLIRPRGPTMFLGLFKLPLLSPITELGRDPAGVLPQRALRERIETFHLFGAWLMFGLLLLHIAGALKHQLIDRQREFARMGVGKPILAV